MKRTEVVIGLKVERIKLSVNGNTQRDYVNGIIDDDKIIEEGTSGKAIVLYNNGVRRATPLNQLRIKE